MIEIDVQIPDKILHLNDILYDVQRQAANRSGFAASKAIEADLQTLEKEKHPLAVMFVSGVQWQKAKQSKQAFAGIAPFARHLLYGSSTVAFGFGYFRGTPRAKEQRKFDKKLQSIARGITEKRVTNVTDAMRRKMGATKGIIGSDPGKTYFPLKRTTTQLVKPARKMNTDEVKKTAVAEFRTAFAEILGQTL